ncbi:hypothetical protein F5Y05DRAFT_405769 [Hypoxylon sp. FL0543]|nr:hypothetical protein F5Y05DRAFT_405769 [Hypoxylon sp. FL0543]
MPSFSITKAEKTENVNHIDSLLRRCGSLLESYGKSLSAFDLRDASFAVHDALFMANDPGACESPPLAKCYLYQGHVLGAMKKYPEARDAYQKAARISSSNYIERAASELAAGLAVHMEHEIREGKRKGGIWSDVVRNDRLIVDQVESHYGYNNERLKEVGTRPIQQVRAGRGFCIESPRLPRLPKPQQVIQGNGDWTAEAANCLVIRTLI